MKTVTKISAQKKPGRYNLFLDHEFVCGVSEQTLIKWHLQKGGQLSEAEVTAMQHEDQLEQGYQLALTYLSYQLRTTAEVTRYLMGKEWTALQIEPILQRLTTQGYLNDKTYATAFVRTEMKVGHKGPQVIRQKLQQRGLSPEIIEQALFLDTTEDQRAALKKLIPKQWQKLSRYPLSQRQQRLKRYCMAQGYAADIVDQVMIENELVTDATHEKELLDQQIIKQTQRYTAPLTATQRQKIKQALYRQGFTGEAIQTALNQFVQNQEFE